MACPLFIPSTPLGEMASGPAPLGELYGGSCSADPSACIGAETLRRYCNFGYARGHCGRAAQSDADAVRLMVGGERGNTVQIAWAVERNHHPVAVGSMEIGADAAGDAAAGDALAMQARACASAYMRQVHGRPAFVGRIAAAVHQ